VTTPADDRGPPPEGWAAFWREHGADLRRRAHKVLGPAATLGITADDIVNEVITNLIKKGIPEGRNPRAYAMTAVTNEAIDVIRTRKHHTDEDIEFDERIGVDDIEEPIDDELLARDLIEAIEELPEREAIAIRERILRGRPATEVARTLNVTTTQRVSQLVNAGLRRLRAKPPFKDLLPTVSPPSSASPATAGPQPEATP
jgi:RNA polymerase sigma factor (sigma-70 family)